MFNFSSDQLTENDIEQEANNRHGNKNKYHWIICPHRFDNGKSIILNYAKENYAYPGMKELEIIEIDYRDNYKE